MKNILILTCAIAVSLCAAAPQARYRYGNPYGSYFQPEEMEVENEFGEGLGPRPNAPIPMPGTAGMGAGTGHQAGAGYQVGYEPPDFEDIYNYQLMNRQAGGQGTAGVPPYGMPSLTPADFTKFDANNDGAIDYNDLFQATRFAEDKEEVLNTFRGSDINFDGRVSRNEFFTFPREWQRLVFENNYYEQLYKTFYSPPQPPPKPPMQTHIARGPVHGQTHGQTGVRGQPQPSYQSPNLYSGTSPSYLSQTQGIDIYPTEPVNNDIMAVDGNYTDASAGNETFVYDYGTTTTYGNDTVGYDGHLTADIGNGIDPNVGMGPDTAYIGAGNSPAVETSFASRSELGLDTAAASANEPAVGASGTPHKQPIGQPMSGADPQQPVIPPKQAGIVHPPTMGGVGARRPTYPQLPHHPSQQFPHQQHRQPQQTQGQGQQPHQPPPQQPHQPPPQQPHQPPPHKPQPPPQQPQYNPYQYPFIDPEDYAEYLHYKQTFYPNMLGGQAGQQGGQQPYQGPYNPLMDEEGGISVEKIARFQAYDQLFGQGQGQGQGQQAGYYRPYGQPTYNPYAQAYGQHGQVNPNLYPPYFD